MGEIKTIRKIFRNHIWLIVLLENAVFGFCLYLTISYSNLALYLDFAISAVVALIFITLISVILSKFITQPFVRQAILNFSPSNAEAVKAPDVKNLTIGKRLISSLIGRPYEIDHKNAMQDGTGSALDQNIIANLLPLPLFILNDQEEIRFANKAAGDYIGISATDLVGKNVYMILDMAFPSEETFDVWLKTTKQKSVIASKSWGKVKLDVRDRHPALIFDLAAYYNKGNIDGNSTMLVLFDNTKQYSQEDQAFSFVALGVHELRIPLTLLSGYMEIFEQELNGKVSPELQSYLEKMQASSNQLMAFANNILNVTRIDNDQLELTLSEQDWPIVLTKAVKSSELQAKIRGISIELYIDPNLPSVGVDRISIQEVISNLIDNAIKYSGTSRVIKVSAKLNGEGLVETTVQDFGIGIPSRVIPNLFTKFYRGKRNTSQTAGTGLGLYLCKAIVKAHSGDIWVRSTEGSGSTFGFTLRPYESLSKEVKSKDNQDMVRVAHGWIKNHSYYRR